MFWNHKELVGFWKVRNLFEELSSLDNDVDCSLREIAIFHFNIKHPKSFDKAFHHPDKTVRDTKTIYQTIVKPMLPVKAPLTNASNHDRITKHSGFWSQERCELVD